ncbi:hypothetical protein Q7C36_004882 [Tachysurus vachellii]|uniref:Uncharacterized protein n=1 Tax=Tachysurus vachellii TaxID=175792 RepID=A0AA88T369_TACVA|nr:hypothetical protein Q7C36_004882 [Tachysurus vachellii]
MCFWIHTTRKCMRVTSATLPIQRPPTINNPGSFKCVHGEPHPGCLSRSSLIAPAEQPLVKLRKFGCWRDGWSGNNECGMWLVSSSSRPWARARSGAPRGFTSFHTEKKRKEVLLVLNIKVLQAERRL